MYLPAHFKESDPQRLADLVHDHPFGMLVTAPGGEPFVSHLPFLFDPEPAPRGRLLGHMARANPQWQHFSAGSEVLVVFQGPHAYVSPAWYGSPGVPTWNYAVAHLRGTARLIEDASELEALLERQTATHEKPMQAPWQPDLAGERRTRLLGMIVGFEIEVSGIEGKFKLSQNRPPEDRKRVIEQLAGSGSQADAALARLMSESADPQRA